MVGSGVGKIMAGMDGAVRGRGGAWSRAQVVLGKRGHMSDGGMEIH